MHVVIAHTGFNLYWIPRIRALARALERDGDRLTVVELSGHGTTYDFAAQDDVPLNGARWLRLFEQDMNALSPRSMSAALFRALEELDPDVVLASAIAFPPGATAVRWCRRRRRPVIIMDDVRDEDVPRSRLTNHVKRRVYRNVDAMLVPAPSHTPSYVQWGVPADRIFYGMDVVDNEWFSAGADAARSNGQEDRSRLGLPRKPYILGVGRQIVRKNWHSLLSAYAAYRRQRGDDAWDLVLVGDGPERSRLEGIAKREIPCGVRFLPFLSQQDLCAAYAFAGAFILPSFRETWGLVVNEAMACGLPIVVGERCACADELVDDGVNGWTFPAEKPDELKACLDRLTDLPPEELRAMGRASREIVARWPLHAFAEGACNAIKACSGVRRGPRSIGDAAVLHLWNGRLRFELRVQRPWYRTGQVDGRSHEAYRAQA